MLAMVFIALSAIPALADSNWESEPNDEKTASDPITLNATWTGNFRNNWDDDWYKFTLPKDGYVRLSFVKPNPDDTSTTYNFYLVDSNGNGVYGNYYSYSNEQYRVKYTSNGIGLAKGTYYLRLTGDSDLGDYTFKVAYAASSTWEKENNDEKIACNAIKLNTTWHGSFRNNWDDDWYKFTLSSAGSVKISFAKPDANDTSTEYNFYLVDSNGDGVYGNYYSYSNEQYRVKFTSESIGLAKGTYYLRLTGDSDLGDYTFRVSTTLSRLAGTDRYKTMAAIVKAGFSSTGGWAIVARGDNFPDALGAAALAGAYSAPIVTTKTGSLDASAKAQLKRLKVKNVIVLGNAKSVSAKTVNQIKAISSVKSVKRVSGSNRYATSLAVYKQFKSRTKSYSTLIVASGESFQDALTAGAYAYKKKAPILLATKKGGLTSAEIKAIKADKRIKRVVVVSTNGAVSYSKVKSQLGSGYTYKSIAGSTVYKTNAAFVKWSVSQGMTAKYPVITTGKKYPDAIAGASLAGKRNSVLVLADTASDPSMAQLAKYRSQIQRAYLLGDKSTISVSRAKAMASKLGLTYVTHTTDSSKKS